MGMFKKVLNAVSPVASVINKSGPVASLLGMKKKGSTGTKGGFGNIAASLAKDPKFKNALQEGQARIAPKKMRKGGKVKKMAYGGKVKSGSSASRRADGCAVKGRTKGRMI
tara:strand:- start:4353 stop:4685 length:333 start_codon:yes stop_codon:yes gene_type:complete